MSNPGDFWRNPDDLLIEGEGDPLRAEARATAGAVEPRPMPQMFDPLAQMVGEFARDFVAPDQRIDAIDRLYVLLKEARTNG